MSGQIVDKILKNADFSDSIHKFFETGMRMNPQLLADPVSLLLDGVLSNVEQGRNLKSTEFDL